MRPDGVAQPVTVAGSPAQLFEDQQVERALQEFDAVLVAGRGHGYRQSIAMGRECLYPSSADRRGPWQGARLSAAFRSRPLGVNCAPGSGVKRLFILRHAKSSWSDTSLGDWQRPLNERGLRDAPRVGDLLRQRALVPDLIITSDAVRARATALAVAQSAGYTGELVVEPSLYHAKPDDVIAVLNSMADQAARSVMIVGHNPGLEDLVRQLTGGYYGLP